MPDYIFALSEISGSECEAYASAQGYSILEFSSWQRMEIALKTLDATNVLILCLENEFSLEIYDRISAHETLFIGLLLGETADLIYSRLYRLGEEHLSLDEDLILKTDLISGYELPPNADSRIVEVEELLETHEKHKDKNERRLFGLLAHSDGYSLNIKSSEAPNLLCGKADHGGSTGYMSCFRDGFCTRLNATYEELSKQNSLYSTKIISADILLFASCFGLILGQYLRDGTGSIGAGLVINQSMRHLITTIGIANFSAISFLEHFNMIRQNLSLGVVAKSLNISSKNTGGAGWVILLGDPKHRYDKARPELFVTELPQLCEEYSESEDEPLVEDDEAAKSFWLDVALGLEEELERRRSHSIVVKQDPQKPQDLATQVAKAANTLSKFFIAHGSAIDFFDYSKRSFRLLRRRRTVCPLCRTVSLLSVRMDPNTGYQRASIVCPFHDTVMDLPYQDEGVLDLSNCLKLSQLVLENTQIVSVCGWEFPVKYVTLEVHPRNESKVLRFEQIAECIVITVDSKLRSQKANIMIISVLGEEIYVLKVSLSALQSTLVQ